MNTVASSEQFPLQPESEFKLLKITFFFNWHITWTSESNQCVIKVLTVLKVLKADLIQSINFLSYVIKKSEIYPIIALYLIFKKALFNFLCSCRNVARRVNIG